MKRIALCLIAAFACFGCDDSDSKDDYDVTAEYACTYIVWKGGDDGFIEIDFDSENATDKEIKAAQKTCVEELNGLPSCKDEVIASASCLAAMKDGKLSDKAYLEAVAKCEENDKACVDKAYDLFPCGSINDASDKCWNDLADKEDAAYHALDDYVDEYYHKY